MYAIGGPESLISTKKTRGYIVDINNGELLSTFNGVAEDGSGFRRPHDVAVSPNGSEVYVVELDKPYTLWKLAYGESDITVSVSANPSLPQYLLDKLLSVIGK